MSTLYKRVAELQVIGKLGEHNLMRTITGLRLSFEITKSLRSYPNLAKITIYNPAPETIALLNTKFARVSLTAGYESRTGVLFQGDIRNVQQYRDGADYLITLHAGDGERDFHNAVYNKTLSEHLSVKAIVTDLIATFKDTDVGDLVGLPEEKDKLRGETLSGSSKDLMDKYADEYGFQWSIQNGEIVTMPIEQTLRPGDATVINAASGMVGIPTITEIGADVKTLLNPALIPNAAIKITSTSAESQLGNLYYRPWGTIRKTAEGVYKLLEVVHTGDTHADDWLSSCVGAIHRGN